MSQNMAGSPARIMTPRELDVIEGIADTFAGFVAIRAKEIKARTMAWREAHVEREAAMVGIQADKDEAKVDRATARDGIATAETRAKEIIASANATARDARAQGGKDAQETRNKATLKAREGDTHLASAIEREIAANGMVTDAEKARKQLDADLGKLATAQAKLKTDSADFEARVLSFDNAMASARKK